MKLRRFLFLIILGTWYTVTAMAQQTAGMFDISAKEARTLISKDSGVVLIDVRSPQEYNQERIANIPLLPLQFVEKRIRDLEQYKKKKIIVYCLTGARSDLAVEILREYGFNAQNMQGGLLQWKALGYPTISGALQ
ncbi:MAG TPA: rhodanese-like domain-containing protein [Bacteroidetes bacterium]|nr:rhodanese-like domain-containing protein [Bacteroidota bacterium]